MNKQYHRWTPGGLSVLVHDDATNDAIWRQIQECPKDGEELVYFAKWAGCSPSDTVGILEYIDRKELSTAECAPAYLGRQEAGVRVPFALQIFLT
jgi:hypothetical protein